MSDDVPDRSEFRVQAEQVTGLSWGLVAWFGERAEFEEQQYARDQGYCCWAGLIASPYGCVWHPFDGAPGEDSQT